jgi:hypothetical protein
VEAVVKAYNNRAAEFVFWNRWPGGREEGYEKLKGIYKTEEVKGPAPTWEEERNEKFHQELVDICNGKGN